MNTIVYILLCTCQDVSWQTVTGTMTHFHDFHLKWSLKETDLTIHQEKMPCEPINNIALKCLRTWGEIILLCAVAKVSRYRSSPLSHCKHMGSRHRKFSFVRITYLRINVMIFGMAVGEHEFRGAVSFCCFHRQSAWIMTSITYAFLLVWFVDKAGIKCTPDVTGRNRLKHLSS